MLHPSILLLVLRVLPSVRAGASGSYTTKPVEHLWGFEADGEYRHVAGSACCHSFADPNPVETPTACEQRCVRNAACDAFVFAPSEHLCFLVRFVERDSSNRGVINTRAATDRVFGAVHRVAEGDGKSLKKDRLTGQKLDTSEEHHRSQRRSNTPELNENQHGFDEMNSLGSILQGFFDQEDFGVPEDCDFCGEHVKFSCDDAFAEQAGTESGFTFGETCNEQCSTHAFGEHCTDMDIEEVLAEILDALKSTCEQKNQTCNVTGTDEACGCGTSMGHEELLRRARDRIWPDPADCVADCESECGSDMQRMRDQSRKLVEQITASLGGVSHAAFIFEMGEDATEEAAFCGQVCNKVCDEVISSRTTPDDDDHEEFNHAVDNNETMRNDTVRRAVDSLLSAFRRAGMQVHKEASSLPLLSGASLQPLLSDAHAPESLLLQGGLVQNSNSLSSLSSLSLLPSKKRLAPGRSMASTKTLMPFLNRLRASALRRFSTVLKSLR